MNFPPIHIFRNNTAKSIVILLCFLYIQIPFLHAQSNYQIEWQRCYGGDGQDEARIIKRCKSGGYIISGYSNSVNGTIQSKDKPGMDDLYIIRINDKGKILWQRTIGGRNMDYGHAWDLCETPYGGFLIAGNTWSTDGDFSSLKGMNDAWLVCLDKYGKTRWMKNFGGAGRDMGQGVLALKNGTYLMYGNQDNKAHLWWINENGKLLKEKSVGSSFIDDILAVREDSKGELYLAGYSHSKSPETWSDLPEAPWIWNLDAEGVLIQKYAYPRGAGGAFYDLELCADGGLIAAGYLYPNRGSIRNQALAVKLNAGFKEDWSRQIGGDFYEGFTDVVLKGDSLFGLIGHTNSAKTFEGFHARDSMLVRIETGEAYSHYSDVLFVELDKQGRTKHRRCFGGNKNDVGNSIDIGIDGKYIFCGTTNSPDGDATGYHPGKYKMQDVWVAKISLNEPNSVNNLPLKTPQANKIQPEFASGKVLNRHVKYDTTISIKHQNIEIRVWDFNKIDNDTISLIFNGETVLNQVMISRQPHSLKLKMDMKKSNVLLLHAHNLGEYPPNTAALYIDDGKKRHKISLGSTLTESGAVRLVYKGE